MVTIHESLLKVGRISVFSLILTLTFELHSFSQSHTTLTNDTIFVLNQLSKVDSILMLDFDKALTVANNALDNSAEINYAYGKGLSVFYIAECYRKNKEWSVSENKFLKAHDILTESGADSLAAECLLRIGFIYRNNGNYEKADDWTQKHVATFEQMPVYLNGKLNKMRINGLIRGTYFLWVSCYYQDKLDEALKVLYRRKQYFTLLETVGINDYNNYGATYDKLGNSDSALYYYNQGLQFAILKGQNNLTLLFLNNTGEILLRQGKFSEAFNIFKKQQALSEQVNNKRMCAFALSGLAQVYNGEGNKSEAISHYVESMKIADKFFDSYDLIDMKINMADFYISVNEISEAKLQLNEALLLSRKLNNQRFAAICLTKLGKLESTRKDYSKAFVYLTEASEFAFQSMNEMDAAGCYFEIARVMLSLIESFRISDTLQKQIDNYSEQIIIDSAIYLFNEAAAIYKRKAALIKYATCIESLGDLNGYRNDNIKACANYLKAIEIYKAHNKRVELFQTCLKLSILYEKQNDHANALKLCKVYIAVKDSVLNEKTEIAFKEIMIKYENEKKDKAIALLNRENQITALAMKEQNALLHARQLEADKMMSDLALSNSEKKIKSLVLDKLNHDLSQRDLELKAQSAQLELAEQHKKQQHFEIESQKSVRNGLLVIAVLIIIIGIFVINRIRLRKQIEKQQAVLNERNRISYDMHDDLGSNLSKIALLTELLKKESDDKNVLAKLGKISSSTHDALEKMSEIIWSLNAKNDSLESLISYIRKYTAEYFEPTNIKCKIILPQQIPQVTLSGEVRRNIFLVVKETLHNIIKHAQATSVNMKIDATENQFKITISDNGLGIDLLQPNAFGNGLNNMQQRMKDAGGSFSIENHNGTSVLLSIALN